MVIISEFITEKTSGAHIEFTSDNHGEITSDDSQIMTMNISESNINDKMSENGGKEDIKTLQTQNEFKITSQIESVAKYALIINKAKVEIEKSDKTLDAQVKSKVKDAILNNNEIQIENKVKSVRFRAVPKSLVSNTYTSISENVPNITNTEIHRTGDKIKTETSTEITHEITSTHTETKPISTNIERASAHIESVAKYGEIVLKKEAQIISDCMDTKIFKSKSVNYFDDENNNNVENDINNSQTIASRNNNIVNSTDSKDGHIDIYTKDVISPNIVKSICVIFEPKETDENVPQFTEKALVKTYMPSKNMQANQKAISDKPYGIHFESQINKETMNVNTDKQSGDNGEDVPFDKENELSNIYTDTDAKTEKDDTNSSDKDEIRLENKDLTVEDLFKDDIDMDNAKIQAKIIAWTKEFETRANFWKGGINSILG